MTKDILTNILKLFSDNNFELLLKNYIKYSYIDEQDKIDNYISLYIDSLLNKVNSDNETYYYNIFKNRINYIKWINQIGVPKENIDTLKIDIIQEIDNLLK
jgi:hypothetical protein